MFPRSGDCRPSYNFNPGMLWKVLCVTSQCWLGPQIRGGVLGWLFGPVTQRYSTAWPYSQGDSCGSTRLCAHIAATTIIGTPGISGTVSSGRCPLGSRKRRSCGTHVTCVSHAKLCPRTATCPGTPTFGAACAEIGSTESTTMTAAISSQARWTTATTPREPPATGGDFVAVDFECSSWKSTLMEEAKRLEVPTRREVTPPDGRRYRTWRPINEVAAECATKWENGTGQHWKQ